MAIIDRIKENLEREATKVTVPEWGNSVLYFTPITCLDVKRMQAKHEKFPASNTAEGLVDLVILKARDEKGDCVFTLEDKPVLMRERMEVIGRVVSQIPAGGTVEEAEKNF